MILQYFNTIALFEKLIEVVQIPIYYAFLNGNQSTNQTNCRCREVLQF